MLYVGLTGGIATGKSRVLARLAEAGLHTIDLDQVAHVVIEPGRPAHAEIAEAFGPTVVGEDGRIDRRALGAIVFTSAAARETLNAIVHPRVFEEEARRIAALPPSGADVVVTDATLLVESGHHLRFDRLVVTHCDRRQQLGRLMHRDGLSAGAAQARIASQMDGAEKARFAHDVVETGGAVHETDAAAASLAERLRDLASTWPAPKPVSRAAAVGALAALPRGDVRGLTPTRVLVATAEAGAPPLVQLARELEPPHPGPWYEAGRGPRRGLGPEVLMVSAIFWSRAWHGPDALAQIASAASVARLVDQGPEQIACALSFAMAVSEILDAGVVPADLAARVDTRRSAIERWSGSTLPSRARRLLESASTSAPTSTPEDAALVAVLHGLATGGDLASAPAEGLAALARLEALAARRRR